MLSLRLAAFGLAAAAALAFGAGGALAQARKPAADAPCVAAAAPAAYGTLLPVSDGLKADVEAYRKAWREACAKKGGTSLAGLLAHADRIGKAFAALLDKADKEKNADALHTLLQQTYPRFIPAFHGSVIEYEYFEPDLEAYARNLGLGDIDDRNFLAQRRALFGTDKHGFPWLERTWDHGGCQRIGQYDYMAAIARFEKVEKEIKGEAYLKRVRDLKDFLRRRLADLTTPREKPQKPVLEACLSKERTLTELDKLAKALAAKAGWEQSAAGIRRVAEGVRAGRIDFCRSCSG